MVINFFKKKLGFLFLFYSIFTINGTFKLGTCLAIKNYLKKYLGDPTLQFIRSILKERHQNGNVPILKGDGGGGGMTLNLI